MSQDISPRTDSRNEGEAPRQAPLWVPPAAMLAGFVLLFGLILWITHANEEKRVRAELAARARSFSGTVNLILEGNAGYIDLLASERSEGKLTAARFQDRVTQYVKGHQELINITWVDADFVIRDVAPLVGNRHIIGLKLELPEPKRVSRLAKERRKPLYTRPFEAIQGNASFELWVPIYRDGTFIGLFGGVYSCEGFIKQVVAQLKPRLYHLGLVDAAGHRLAEGPRIGTPDRRYFRDVPLVPDGEIFLRITPYERRSDWRLFVLQLLSVILVIGMAHALWKLQLQIKERKKAEEKLGRQALLLEHEVEERQSAQENLQEQAALLEEEIAERRQAEEALSESEERLRLLLDSTGEGIYGVDLEGRCTFCNRAMLRMLRYDDPEQLLGGDIHQLIHHSHPDGTPLPKTACAVHSTMGTPKGTHVDSDVFWRGDGTSFPVEYWSYPQVKGGKVIGSVVAFIDITQRRQLEEQFRQSQKMESIGRLAGGVAHDFNNMLSVILGAVELCKVKVPEGEPLRDYLEVIFQAAQRSSAITRQLLAFSRKEVVSPRAVDLNRQITETRGILSRLVTEDVTLSFIPGKELWTVLIDPSQVDQVLMNLAANARDAMPGGGSLTIETCNVHLDAEYASLHAEATEGDYVQLTVGDTGHGMDRSIIGHIFEPFFTTKETGKGTGLGLATVYGIVTQNKGFINVYSEPGHGSAFRIYLPRLKEAVPEPPPPAAAPKTVSATILVVEDEEILLWLASRLLEELGYRVLQAHTPAKALELCSDAELRIDLVMTDMVMPEMNGMELVDRIRKMRPGVKVLLMSGYTADGIARRGVIEEGMQYIQKPLQMKKLDEKIREVLSEN